MSNAELLKQLRQKKRLSLRDVARAVDYSSTYIHEIENGRKEGSRAFWLKVSAKYGKECEFEIPGDDSLNILKVENEKLRSEIDRLHQQFTALASAWQSDWLFFDGRQLYGQIDSILIGKNRGSEFYHDHIVEDHNYSLPNNDCIEHGCKICAEAKEAKGE